MRNMFLAMGKLGTLGVAFAGGLALVGCAGGEPAPPTTIEPRANSILLEFTGHASPKNRTLTTHMVNATAFGPNLEPESIDPITLDQYGGGSNPPPNIADLVTTNCTDNYPTQSTFVCTVELRQFYTRTLPNAFVQVTSLTSDTGQDISSTHAATNSYSGNSFGLDASKGLWQYTSDAYAGNSFYAGVMAQSPNNVGTQEWDFANPDDADTNYKFAIWASKGFANYTFAFGNASYTDACTGGTSSTANNTVKATLPAGFDFTLYGVNSTNSTGQATIEFNKLGQLGIGTTTLTASTTPINLPSTSAPHPIFFPFWDNLKYGTGGKLCYKTIGSAPSRQFVVEWRKMDFTNNPGKGSVLDFEAILYEGTNEIDTFYNSMVGTGTSAGRENGAKAYVGLQDQTGTVATGEFQVQDYGTGNGYAYVPNPQ